MAYTIYIRGIPENPQVKEVRVHTSPGLNTDVPFKAPLNATATCTDIKPDPGNDSFNGQVYKWFNLTFSDGRTGWVRDDLLDLQGDCTGFGYGNYDSRTYAFTAAATPAATPASASASTPAPAAVSPTPTVSAQPAAAPAATPAASAPAAASASSPAAAPAAAAASSPNQSAPAITVISTTTTTAPTPPPSSCTANVRADTAAKLRAQPSVNAAVAGKLDPGASVQVLNVLPGQDGGNFRWIQTNVNGTDCYVREDLLVYGADCAALGLGNAHIPATPAAATADPSTMNQQTLFATPLKITYNIYQEFGDTRFGSAHKGADLTGPNTENQPLVSTGNGTVFLVNLCSKCTPQQPTFQSQGLQFWDPQAIRDPAWGYGFGNHAILRYAWTDLPSTTRQELSNRNLAGAYAYVIYAHMNRIDVTQDQQVSVGTQIGLLGNTGNSTGHHLHLELHFSMNEKEYDYFNRLNLNPRIMYQI